MQDIYENPFVMVVDVIFRPSEFQKCYFVLLTITAIFLMIKWKISPTLLANLDNPNINKQTVFYCLLAMFLAPIVYVVLLVCNIFIYENILHRGVNLQDISNKKEREDASLYMERIMEVYIIHSFIYKTIFLFGLFLIIYTNM